MMRDHDHQLDQREAARAAIDAPIGAKDGGETMEERIGTSDGRDEQSSAASAGGIERAAGDDCSTPLSCAGAPAGSATAHRRRRGRDGARRRSATGTWAAPARGAVLRPARGRRDVRSSLDVPRRLDGVARLHRRHDMKLNLASLAGLVVVGVAAGYRGSAGARRRRRRRGRQVDLRRRSAPTARPAAPPRTARPASRKPARRSRNASATRSTTPARRARTRSTAATWSRRRTRPTAWRASKGRASRTRRRRPRAASPAAA